MRLYIFFFFNDTATTEIYTLSLHDALPICSLRRVPRAKGDSQLIRLRCAPPDELRIDRKSTRLNSSHSQISYAVFCLKKKKTIIVVASMHIPTRAGVISKSALTSSTSCVWA